MSEERKADMDKVLAELKFEIWLAIKQGRMTIPFQWSEVIDTEGDPWFAVLTIGKVGEDGRAP